MTTHSSILAWKIPWTEEPCWLQSMGSQEQIRKKKEKKKKFYSLEYMKNNYP